MILSIPQSEINKLLVFTQNNILTPKLKEISRGIRKNIADKGKRIRASNRASGRPSIGSIYATNSVIERKTMRATIKPLIPKIFNINKKGYVYNRRKYVDKNPGLREWVELNFRNPKYKQAILDGERPLVVRSKTSKSKYNKVPLGAPERDIFTLGFNEFIINKGMYGLS